MFFRCNGQNNCNDASDEISCDKVSVPISYQNETPPPPKNGENFAHIYLNIEISEVLELHEVHSIMTLQYKLTLKWRDSRVVFRNLKQDTFLNTLDTQDTKKIWYPQVVLYNTENKENTQVNQKL